MADGPARAEGPASLVVIDDAPEVRMFVRARLRRSGRFHVVGEGGTGRDAIDLARLHRPAVVLLDVSMPIMDGLEALPEIRRASPETRVVMYTGFDSRGLADRAMRLGADAFIEKSPSADLAAELASVLRLGDGVDRPAEPSAAAPDPASDTRVLDAHLERFREVFEEAAIGMGTMTLTGRVVRANRRLGEILGLTPDDIVGRPYATLASDREPVDEAITRGGDPDVTQFEHGVRQEPGRRVLVTMSPVRDEQRRPLYLFLQAQDVTAQAAAKEDLRQSEERFRLLVEAVEDYAIFMLDPSGHVVSWNTGAERIKGYASNEIIGQHFRVFYPPDKQDSRHPEHELRVALREGHYEEEGWRVRKDGSQFWANVLITAVRDQSGEHVGFAKVTRDASKRLQAATERERTLAELGDANRRLETANRRLARVADEQAQYLAVTAHELRTPIGILVGSAESLVTHRTEIDDAERDDTIRAMKLSGARLRRLLADVLAAARLDAGQLRLRREPVELTRTLRAAAAAARSLYPGVEIEVVTTGEVWADADPDRVSQIVDNLLTNAVRHGVSPIHVGVGAHGGARDLVRIDVHDQGPGVEADIEPVLFQRFATGAATGTGLGLFIVRELARAHGGDATYERTATGGCFVVTLPAFGLAEKPDQEGRLATPR